jgi:hypothetical protein
MLPTYSGLSKYIQQGYFITLAWLINWFVLSDTLYIKEERAWGVGTIMIERPTHNV